MIICKPYENNFVPVNEKKQPPELFHKCCEKSNTFGCIDLIHFYTELFRKYRNIIFNSAGIKAFMLYEEEGGQVFNVVIELLNVEFLCLKMINPPSVGLCNGFTVL